MVCWLQKISDTHTDPLYFVTVQTGMCSTSDVARFHGSRGGWPHWPPQIRTMNFKRNRNSLPNFHFLINNSKKIWERKIFCLHSKCLFCSPFCRPVDCTAQGDCITLRAPSPQLRHCWVLRMAMGDTGCALSGLRISDPGICWSKIRCILIVTNGWY
jgi:hypothetical protein